MNELISVIVPIYKVEQWLEDCVDSILAQSYENLEVILVDDGSPDESGRICDRYALKDERVRVVHKENGGLSDARNAGLEIARGSYYYFVDSDDILPDNSIETMYRLLQEHGAQMVIGGFERFRDESKEVFFSTEEEGLWTHVYDREGAFRDFYRDGCQAWAVLYQRSIHENIRFPKGEINEDEAIVFSILENCDTVVVTNRVVYSYRCREESITTASFSKKKLVWAKHCAANLEFIRQNHPALTDLAVDRYRASLLWSLTEMALSDQDFSREIKLLRQELKAQRKLLRRTPFTSRQERLRLEILLNLPFGIYKRMLRVKRRA